MIAFLIMNTTLDHAPHGQSFAERIDTIGRHIGIIVSQNFWTELSQPYFGDILRHASTYNENGNILSRGKIIPEDQLQLFSRILGRIHGIYRNDLVKPLIDCMAIDALQPETQALIAQMDAALVRYRSLVIDTRDGIYPQNFSRIDKETYDTITKNITDIHNAIAKSELNNPHRNIPIRTNNGEIHWERNIEAVGFFIYMIRLIRRAQVDHNKIPPLLGELISLFTGVTHEVTKNIRIIIAGTSLPKRTYEESCRTCYSAIKHEIEMPQNSHAIQMAFLVNTQRDFQDACKNLLAEFDIPPYPKRLETPSECSIVAETIPGLSLLIRQCAEIEERKRQYIEEAVMRSAETLLNEIAGRSNTDERLLKQIKLIQEFLQNHRGRNTFQTRTGR